MTGHRAMGAHQRIQRKFTIVERGLNGWIARNPWTRETISESMPTRRSAYAACWAVERPPIHCTRCGETDLSKFGSKGNGRPRATCRACTNIQNWESRQRVKARDPEKYYQRRRRWTKETRLRRGPEKTAILDRKTKLKMNYGMTLADFDALLLKQGDVCAICFGPKGARQWHVDHDHKTGAVRGILCNNCNTGLGLFKENQVSLARAIEYLSGAAT